MRQISSKGVLTLMVLPVALLCFQGADAEENPWGMCFWPYWADTAINVDTTVALGVSIVRLTFIWSHIQWSGPDDWRWNQLDKNYDAAVRNCRENDLEILGILGLTPRWASSRYDRDDYYIFPPTNWGWYYTFVDSVVERYDGDSIGAPDPDSAHLYRVDYWEVWNEADNFLRDPETIEGVSAEYYRDTVLIPTYPRIKSADSTATVVSSCSANWGPEPGRGFDWTDTLLDRIPEAYPYFDMLNYHCYLPYRVDPADTLGWALDTLRFIVNDHDAGLDTIPIWLTEIGWYTHDPNPGDSLGVSPDTQALYLLHSCQVWSDLTDSLNLGKYFWYCLKDDPGWPDTAKPHARPWGVMDTLCHYRKPSYSVYQNYIGSPEVTVITPNGGEDWACEASDTVKWTASDNYWLDSVHVYYSTDFVQPEEGAPGWSLIHSCGVSDSVSDTFFVW